MDKKVDSKKHLQTQFIYTVKSKLGRKPERNLSNNFVNIVAKAIKEYHEVTTLKDALDILITIKPAKGIDELVHNISKNLKAGTRTDRSILELDEIF